MTYSAPITAIRTTTMAAPMSVKQMHTVLDNVSIYTIQKEVKILLAEDRIEKIGNTKGARYVYKRE